MKFSDLTKDQRTEAKQRLLCERLEKGENRTPSCGELADVDETISDKEAEEAFAGTEFVSDDFSCGVAVDRDAILDDLKEWAERELVLAKYAKRYAKPGALEVEQGIYWARKALLDHIEAVRL